MVRLAIATGRLDTDSKFVRVPNPKAIKRDQDRVKNREQRQVAITLLKKQAEKDPVIEAIVTVLGL